MQRGLFKIGGLKSSQLDTLAEVYLLLDKAVVFKLLTVQRQDSAVRLMLFSFNIPQRALKNIGIL